MALEADVARWMQALNEENAHHIVTKVSKWAGNRRHSAVVHATPVFRKKMYKALLLFNASDGPVKGIDSLVDLPGIRLIIASKIFRFCYPAVGAAVDRHTSYFFNSLKIISAEGHRNRATNFRREWSNGPNSSSRLAIYTNTGYHRNRNEFFFVYLPLLDSVAKTLNSISALYQCEATGEQRNWRPTDVDMATYYWGAGNGAR